MSKIDFKILADDIVKSYDDHLRINFIGEKSLPRKDKVKLIIEQLLDILFPGNSGRGTISQDNILFITGELLFQIYNNLSVQVLNALRFKCELSGKCQRDCTEHAQNLVNFFLQQLPEIREVLRTDVQAAYDGDPAAQSLQEVILSYPFIYTIAIHRLAHELYKQDIPLIPRMMSEIAHAATGIDIHPGAKIGKYFFIDHGTGVVVGETAIIGDNVKIYQGVTLGALSFPKDKRGKIIKGGKRHPTIEDGVTIYAEATILGNVVIGSDSVIGGNVWIKESCPSGTVVTMANPDLVFRSKK